MAVAEHHGHDHSTTSVRLAPRTDGSDRVAAVQRARWLNTATIGWNSIEGVVAVTAGLTAGSVSLVAFGFDSAIEVSAALALTWGRFLPEHTTAVSLLDQLRHHAVVAATQGDSYRMKQARTRGPRTTTTTT